MYGKELVAHKFEGPEEDQALDGVAQVCAWGTGVVGGGGQNESALVLLGLWSVIKCLVRSHTVVWLLPRLSI